MKKRRNIQGAKGKNFWRTKRVVIGVVAGVLLVAAFVGAFLFLRPPQSNFVGITFSTSDIPRWRVESARIKEQLIAKGYTAEVRFAQGDKNLQAQQIQDFVDLGAKVIVVNPVDGENLVPVMKEAHAKGVKFIAHDRLIVGGPIDYFVTVRMQDMGRISAEQMLLRNVGKHLVYVMGDPADTNAVFHRDGTMKALEYAIERGDVVLRAELPTDWSEGVAYKVMAEYLKEHKDVDAVITGYDELAEGVARALREAGIAGVYVTGGNAYVSTCEAIRAGDITVTFLKPEVILADASIAAADSFMRGESPEVFGVTDNGFMRVSSNYIAPVMIDASNVNMHIENKSCTTK
ncbi:hypothetical protein A3C89_03130 [Candidatus Kaiserbacteria bacterium RIFCSPHIGHO2_02_FULL_50_50]|uniref:Periplasmic binding protein domain-containing protein n=1 Tax=Candidatus Kaiserbacteria bacterium RIFCSPHIGHO2_02_FULL_50_50 TaxID=1798492 RepID=A0A1F6DEQ6_9BACT|nr:MAG: hypothetical protein A3C89_03130 [Candidatus Kaiserbacteria bacterium RIFCSPHIGHO2_02_FULL_50_50]OGG89090.1 MAG: hypothetical protein A3G62_02160 [Candidatus Kaiserbacteria bacterium RIFCSPLOWO2_12_FULL_50_10]